MPEHAVGRSAGIAARALEADGINSSFSALIRNASVLMFGITALPMAAGIAPATVDPKIGLQDDGCPANRPTDKRVAAC